MMEQKKESIFKRYKSTIVSFVIVSVAVIIGWVALYMYCHVRSNSEYSYEFIGNKMSGEQNGMSIDIAATKSWKDMTYHKDTPFGYQYDITVSNDTKFDFVDWSADLTFTNPPILDSSWNGDYEVDGNVIHYVARDPVDIIPSSDSKVFGGVIYVKRGTQIESCTIKGHGDVRMMETGWFWTMLEISLLAAIGIIIRIFSIFRASYYRRKIERDAEIIEQSMKTLTQFIDAKDAYTKDHSARVADYAREIGRRIGMSKEETNNLYYITLLHDCGKIAVPDEILKKEGALTPQEFAIVKTHTSKGNELLKKFTALPGIGDGAHYHHERYDGYGYPSGLEGEEIPLYARIICVADAYDAMSSNRCYRKALDKERILSELELNSSKQFDPKFVKVMIDMIEDGFTEKIRSKYPIE